MLTPETARELITTAPGLCVVYFWKRTDGMARRMLCRAYRENEPACPHYRFNPVAKNLLPVWDAERGAPRMVNLDAVELVVMNGRRYASDADAAALLRTDRPPVPPKRPESSPSRTQAMVDDFDTESPRDRARREARAAMA